MSLARAKARVLDTCILPLSEFILLLLLLLLYIYYYYYLIPAPPIIVGAWSMAVMLWQQFEYYYY